ncbi:MAG: leucine-rich repeat domain-containing protein [Kiritimatiellae bacterium]|nr:leucine-rich repeat domain-containing protein [Kiritimatiellia bacterium]
MKKFLLTLCLLIGCATLHAATATVNGITWTYKVVNGEATIGTGGWSPAIPSSTSGAISIPSTLGGYPVTAIGSQAFYNCNNLTSITIPSSVTSIGDYAFENCYNLPRFGGARYESAAKIVLIDVPNSVTGDFFIPNGVRFINSLAFSGCSSLTSVTIPSSVTSIGSSAFSDCSSLTSVTIPSSVTSIGNAAFYYCSGLTSITIPKGITFIGGQTFQYCSSLTSVIFPEGITLIGNYAFENCSSLTSVTLPESISSIGSYVFTNCTNLALIHFEGTPPSVGDETFYKVFATGSYLPKYAEAWESDLDVNGKWNGLTMSRLTINTFSMTLTVVGNGTATGAGYYATDETVTVTAMPAEGYVFCGWSESSAKSATYTFTMPEKPVEIIAYFAPKAAVDTYVTMNNLMIKEEAVQSALDADEVFTADEIKEMAFGSPIVEAKEDVIEIAISLQTAETLNAWQAMALQGATLEIDEAKGLVRVKVPKGDQKAAFYKFVMPTKEEAQEKE